MIDSLIGGIYTLIIISISGWVGYLIGTKQFQTIIEDKIKFTTKNIENKPGIVKMKTPQQFINDKNKEGERIRELLK